MNMNQTINLFISPETGVVATLKSNIKTNHII